MGGVPVRRYPHEKGVLNFHISDTYYPGIAMAQALLLRVDVDRRFLVP
jgi:hypothetical protein